MEIQLLPTCTSGAAADRLASGAEIGAPVLHDDSLDGAAAHRAQLTTSVSDFEIEMGCAQFALGADIRVNAGAFVPDGCLKNSADTVIQSLHLLSRQLVRLPQRVKSSGKESFVSIHVADPSDNILVEKRGFYRDVMPT